MEFPDPHWNADRAAHAIPHNTSGCTTIHQLSSADWINQSDKTPHTHTPRVLPHAHMLSRLDKTEIESQHNKSGYKLNCFPLENTTITKSSQNQRMQFKLYIPWSNNRMNSRRQWARYINLSVYRKRCEQCGTRSTKRANCWSRCILSSKHEFYDGERNFRSLCLVIASWTLLSESK